MLNKQTVFEPIGKNTVLQSKKVNDVFSKYQMHGGMSSPLPNWLFDVTFGWSNWAKAEFDIADGDNLNDTFRCIKIDLPQYEQATKEVYFFGTKKTFVVSRDTSGETTLDFWVRNPASVEKGKSSTLNFIDVLVPTTAKTMNWKHLEFARLLDYIEIMMMNADTTKFRRFKLYNPVITNFSFGGELNYEGEEGLKMSITVHYDALENKG